MVYGIPKFKDVFAGMLEGAAFKPGREGSNQRDGVPSSAVAI